MVQQTVYKGLCVTDLDGTLLNLQHIITDRNRQVLECLGEKQICRVAATGRSIYSLSKVLTPDSPFDYVVFSTGAGIMDWQNQKVILARQIDSEQVISTYQRLVILGEDFFFHAPIPENHRFIAIKGKGLADFYNRIRVYSEFGQEWQGGLPLPWKEGTQFLVVADHDGAFLHAKLALLLAPLQVIRTTSPFDHKSIWLEIFAQDVSKGSAVSYLLEMLGLSPAELMAVGNDYNDWDMLKLTPHAFVTSNAPAELQKLYQVVADHNDDGFAEAVDCWLN